MSTTKPPMVRQSRRPRSAANRRCSMPEVRVPATAAVVTATTTKTCAGGRQRTTVSKSPSTRMQILPEHHELVPSTSQPDLQAMAGSVARRQANANAANTNCLLTATPYEMRPRVFSFPSKQPPAPVAKSDKWASRDEWLLGANMADTDRRHSHLDAAGQPRSRAELEFLASPRSSNFVPLKTFECVRGKIVHTGNCYRSVRAPLSNPPENIRHLKATANCSTAGDSSSSGPADPKRSEYQSQVSVGSNASATKRRFTCPDILLSRAESFEPQAVHRVELWIVGDAYVGKTALAEQLLAELTGNEAGSLVGEPATPGASECAYASCMLDKNELLVCVHVGDETAMASEGLHNTHDHDNDNEDNGRVSIVVPVYDITNRSSLAIAVDIVKSAGAVGNRGGTGSNAARRQSIVTKLLRRVSSDEFRSRPANLVLVANKADLERQRKIKHREGSALAAVYGADFVEVSTNLALNIQPLLHKILLLVHRSLKHNSSGLGSSHCISAITDNHRHRLPAPVHKKSGSLHSMLTQQQQQQSTTTTTSGRDVELTTRTRSGSLLNRLRSRSRRLAKSAENLLTRVGRTFGTVSHAVVS